MATSISCYRDGPTAFLSDRENLIASAIVRAGDAKGVLAAEIARPLEVTRGGEGTSTGGIELGGNYLGDKPLQQLVFEIINGGSNSRPSNPVYAGRGQGAMSQVIAPPTMAPQEVIVTLKNRDQTPARATGLLGGIEIAALETGNKRIEIRATSQLMKAMDPRASLINELAADTKESDKPDHNLGALKTTARGTLDPTHNRFMFEGGGSDIYRQHVEQRDGKDYYIFTPAIVRDMPIGTRVFDVTGGYTVTVDDGVNTPEVYANLITLYDLFAALQNSGLVEVVTPITRDERPGGLAVVDINIPALPEIVSATAIAANNEVTDRLAIPEVTLDANAIAGRITATVEDVSDPSAPVWTWRRGTEVLGTSLPGEPFTGGGLTATIAERLPVVNQTKAEAEFTNVNFAAQSAEPNEGIYPQLRWKGGPGVGYILGRNFPGSMTLRFVYTQRPSDECLPETAGFTGSLDATCVGVDPAIFGQGDGMATGIVRDKLQILADYIAQSKADNNQRTRILGGAFENEIRDVSSASENQLFDFIDTNMRMLAMDIAELLALPQIGGGTKSGSDLWDETLLRIQQLPAIVLLNSGSTAIQSLENYNAQGIASGIGSIINKAYFDAGFDSPKSNASTRATGCWQDTGAGAYFRVFVGDTEYQHFVPGEPWYSARQSFDDDGNEIIVDTLELALHISMSCANLISADRPDEFSVEINGGDVSAGYVLEDQFSFDLAPPSPTILSGGVDGGFVRVFGVRTTVDGVLEDYVLDLAAPAAYTSATLPGLSWLISEGGREYDIGDRYRFQVGRQQYRYSTDGGATFSTPADIPTAPATAPIVFADSSGSSVSALFRPGAGLSFDDGDQFPFELEGNFGAGRAQQLDDSTHQVDGALDRIYDFAGGTDQPVEMISVLASTAVTVQLLGAGDAPVGSPIVFNGSTEPEFELIDPVLNARAMQITAPAFTGHTLGWSFAGVPLRVMRTDNLVPVYSAQVETGQAINPLEKFLGEGYGLTLTWNYRDGTTGFLQADDLEKLRVFMAWIKRYSKRVVVVPNDKLTAAYVCRWITDNLASTDEKRRMLSPDATDQLISTQVQLGPVYHA